MLVCTDIPALEVLLREPQDYPSSKQIYNDPVFQGGANSRAEQFRVEGVSSGERMSPGFVQQPRNTKTQTHIDREDRNCRTGSYGLFVYLSERRTHMNVITK